jgi:dipeptidyl-peptidase 4
MRISMPRCTAPRFTAPRFTALRVTWLSVAASCAVALSVAALPLSAQIAPAAPGATQGTTPGTVPATVPATAMSAERYAQAERLLSQNLTPLLFRADVSPVWGEGDGFSYRVRVPGGFEFIQVDPAGGTRDRAFDHDAVAQALSAATGGSFTALTLPFTSFTWVAGGSAGAAPGTLLQFTHQGGLWQCDVHSARDMPGTRDVPGTQCTRVGAAPAAVSGIRSPDGRHVAFRRNNNLWIRTLETGEERALTTDGEERYGYGTDSQGWRQGNLPILLWSPDSRSIATFRLDERGVEEMHLLRTAEPRPILQSWPYALPSDTIVPMVERVVVHLDGPRVVRLDTEPDHQRASSCCGMARGEVWADVMWSEDARTLAFVSVSRDYRTATFRVADPETGAVRTVYSESHPKFFESHAGERGLPNWRLLADQGAFLWFSQRDGWGHLYVYDLETGALRNRVTGGDWNVLDILHLDAESGTLLFTAVGRERGEDPYWFNLYRVGLDGSGLTLLTPEPGHHEVTLSPSARYFVSRTSTVNTPPVITLRRTSDGGVVRVLEEADPSQLLATGWQPPRPFSAKARDGVTDVHGLYIVPSDFDPTRRYPVINAIYPGPQSGSVGTRAYAVSRRGQAHALAELGFIVVLIDAMGTPFRSKDFHTAYYGDMGDNGLPDHISAMRELAATRPYMDLDRVGIFGHSGGGFATAAALLRHPDFFHVGVAGAGNHDNAGYTFYWGEKYHGPFERFADGTHSYEVQANHLRAENLEGRLLLSYGTLDNNVHPNTTLLLIDRLIAANKDFDVLVMPNRGHGYSGESYAIRRTWDYFVTHLLGETPPREYTFGR